MSRGTVRLTREELHEQAWSEPMQRFAKKYGISDVGLAKTCRGMRIPLAAEDTGQSTSGLDGGLTRQPPHRPYRNASSRTQGG